MMDKKQKKGSSKNAKPAKKNAVEEKTVRPQPKATKSSYDLPAVISKDTLLLDYDYNKQYSKRNVVSNWDRYADIRDDDDDDNGQLSAADFEQLLSASKSIGDHFTFSAERTWLQSVDANQTDENSMASDLFKLNISNLKNGISRLPFYKRQDLSQDIFTNEEITNLNHRAKFFDKNESNRKVSTDNQLINNPTKKIVEKSPIESDLVHSLQKTELSDKPMDTASLPTTSASSSVAPLPVKPPKIKSNKTEDIQDWLDDILNES
ncbi:uncharacterized protein LOC116343049 [Contarinia nasturtii]|uniref:uncharacterized protein LOC116343049 n=1 Tax=Contarinia nasturtii TaxID=265458 RepID=UPI0012D46D8E|nr:uncharacterized protein LOC116343049 [Contarinia nasturtii]